MGKERYERKCIEDLLTFTQGKATERYVKKFREYSVIEDWSEAPDFLLFNQEKYCGIEHFVVDVFYDEIEGQVRSGSRLVCGNTDNTYQKYHKDLEDDIFNAKEAGIAVENCIQQKVDLLSSFNYTRFVDKFKQTLEKHIGKVPRYHEHLAASGYPSDVPMFFCIEERVLNETSGLVFRCKMIRHDGAIILDSPRIIPLTDEIVEVFETNCGKIKGIFIASYDMKDLYEQRMLDMIFLDMTSKEALHDSIKKQKRQVFKSFYYDIPQGKIKLNVI